VEPLVAFECLTDGRAGAARRVTDALEGVPGRGPGGPLRQRQLRPRWNGREGPLLLARARPHAASGRKDHRGCRGANRRGTRARSPVRQSGAGVHSRACGEAEPSSAASDGALRCPAVEACGGSLRVVRSCVLGGSGAPSTPDDSCGGTSAAATPQSVKSPDLTVEAPEELESKP